MNATVNDVKAAMAALLADVDTAATAVSTELAALTTQVTTLQQQITSGTGVSSADLDAVLLQIQTADAKVKAIAPAPDHPAVAAVVDAAKPADTPAAA